MKNKALIKNMSLLISLYLTGTLIATILLNYYDYTFYEVSYIFLAMSLISLFFAGYFSNKMICEDCKMFNGIVITILIIMAIFLLFTFFDMRQEWELLIF